MDCKCNRYQMSSRTGQVLLVAGPRMHSFPVVELALELVVELVVNMCMLSAVDLGRLIRVSRQLPVDAIRAEQKRIMTSTLNQFAGTEFSTPWTCFRILFDTGPATPIDNQGRAVSCPVDTVLAILRARGERLVNIRRADRTGIATYTVAGIVSYERRCDPHLEWQKS